MNEPIPLTRRRRLNLWMARTAEVVASKVSFRDVMLFAGCGLLGYGLSLVFWPAAFIVPGLIFSGVAIFGVR